jgi:hypothetical protein
MLVFLFARSLMPLQLLVLLIEVQDFHPATGHLQSPHMHVMYAHFWAGLRCRRLSQVRALLLHHLLQQIKGPL